MTNEQAAECLKTIHVLSFKDETATFFLTDVQNAFKLAIKALEQQSCEDWYDVPSDEMTLEQARQAVKDLRKKLAEYLEQQPCEDCISRVDILDAIETWDKFGINAEQKLIRWQDHYVPYVHLDDVRHAIANMPSVTLQPKVGKWIIRPDRASDIEYRCSECGKIQFADDTNELNYCCNCGAKMEVSE